MCVIATWLRTSPGGTLLCFLVVGWYVGCHWCCLLTILILLKFSIADNIAFVFCWSPCSACLLALCSVHVLASGLVRNCCWMHPRSFHTLLLLRSWTYSLLSFIAVVGDLGIWPLGILAAHWPYLGSGSCVGRHALALGSGSCRCRPHSFRTLSYRDDHAMGL